MLHVATLHFKTPRWIPIQARELHRHIAVPYRTWTSLEGIDASYGRYFDHVIEQRGSHGEKLNHLAIEIAHEAEEDDLLMFLDGDAFPIADPAPLIEAGLSTAPLLAVRRAESGSPLPHPCFCVTHVGTWRCLPGDWGKGFVLIGPRDVPVSDVGANLLRQLELSETPWTQVLRSNRRNPHPLLFGIYGDAIYHHGAGFRTPLTLTDLAHLDSFGLKDGPSPELQEIKERNRRKWEAVFRRIERDEAGWLAEFI